jgi:hypothetical protein
MGASGHIAFVFDENAGYYGAPARAVRCASDGEPTRTWYMDTGRPFFCSTMYEDIAATFDGGTSAYPVTAADGRHAIETAFAAYRSATTGTEVLLPLAIDDLYTRGLASLARPQAV